MSSLLALLSVLLFGRAAVKREIPEILWEPIYVRTCAYCGRVPDSDARTCVGCGAPAYAANKRYVFPPFDTVKE